MSENRTDGTPRSPRGNGRALLSLLHGGQTIRSAPSGCQLYMLLDTARDPRVYARLIELGDAVRARSLYQGDIGESLAHVSPYLLSLQDDKPESRWFAEAGFGQSWGLFITTPIGFDELRRHLRKFNVVYREDRVPLVFRFYDPRVLRQFLPTCTADELHRFFGPVESFLTETEAADALVRFTLRGDELMRTRLPVPV